MTVDPSKYCHFVKKLDTKKTEAATNTILESAKNLTWDMEEKDTEITKEIRGEFPEYKSPRQKKRLSDTVSTESKLLEYLDGDYINSFEVVRHSKQQQQPEKTWTGKSKFDSDSGEDTDDVISSMKSSNSKKKVCVKNSLPQGVWPRDIKMMKDWYQPCPKWMPF